MSEGSAVVLELKLSVTDGVAVGSVPVMVGDAEGVGVGEVVCGS